MAETATAPATAPDATLELLDPEKITVRNIRDAKPSQRLIDSIHEHGVLQPIGVLRTADGELVLRFGDRRRQACILLRYQVPAIVVDGTVGTDRDEIERIFGQLDENDNRQDLTAADRAAAVAALFDLGATQRMITHKTGLAQAEIAAARRVAASQTARQLAAQYPLTLEQLAEVTDFEDDDQAVEALTGAAGEGPGRFAHALQQARDAQADREALAEHIAKLAKRGITVASQTPHYENALYNWADADGNRLDEKAAKKKHEKCPGNVVVLHVGWGHEVSESWYCTDPKAHGHKRYRMSGATDQTPEERRQVIEGNKAWRSAEQVRRTWLRDFLSRPKVPDGALLFTLEAFVRSDNRLIHYGMESRMDGQHAMARELLGLPKAESRHWNMPPEVHTAITKASPAGAQVIALAVVLGAYEASTSAHSWRSPDTATAEYLEALAGWGYELSDIEQELVTSARKREADQTTAAADGDTS